MSNLGDSNTPISGELFGLPSGWTLTENNDGEAVFEDTQGNVVLRRDATNNKWVTDEIDASSATLGSGTIDTETDQPDGIARVSQVQTAAAAAIYTDETEPPVPESEAVWFDTSGTTDPVAAFTFDSGENETLPFGSEAAYAPTERISAHPTSSGNVFTVDANGNNVWTFNVGNFAGDVQYASSEDIFICGSGGSGIFAVNPSDGSQVWHNSTADSTNLLLAEDQGLVVCTSSGGDTFAVNLSDGSLEWTYSTNIDLFEPIGYSSANGVVSFAGQDGTPDYYAVGIDITDGSEVWQTGISTIGERGAVQNDGSSFVVPYGTTVEGLDAADGSSLWTYTASDDIGSRIRHLSSISSFVFGDQSGNVYALADSDGAENWMSGLDTSAFESQIAYSSATGSFFISGNAGYLYRVDETDGSEIWAYNLFDEGDAEGGGIYNPDDKIAVYGTAENLILGVNLEAQYIINSLDSVNVTDKNTNSWVGKTL